MVTILRVPSSAKNLPSNRYKYKRQISAGDGNLKLLNNSKSAWRRHVRRAKPDATGTEHAVVVCHGNVIRYFLCRGLQLPPTAWLHMTLPHCSVSYLHCRPSGTGLGILLNSHWLTNQKFSWNNRNWWMFVLASRTCNCDERKEIRLKQYYLVILY